MCGDGNKLIRIFGLNLFSRFRLSVRILVLDSFQSAIDIGRANIPRPLISSHLQKFEIRTRTSYIRR